METPDNINARTRIVYTNQALPDVTDLKSGCDLTISHHRQ